MIRWHVILASLVAGVLWCTVGNAVAPKEKMVIFDCEQPQSANITKQYAQIYDTETVTMEATLTPDAFLKKVADTIKKHKSEPRIFGLFCHGVMKGDKLYFERWLLLDEGKRKIVEISVEAAKFRRTAEDAIKDVDRKEVVFFLNACNSGAIRATFPQSDQCFGEGTTICASCPKDKWDNGDQMVEMLLRVHRNCEKVDLNRDSKIDVHEFSKWATDENERIKATRAKARKELEAFYKDDLEKAEADLASTDPDRQEAGRNKKAAIQAVFKELDVLERERYFGAPILMGMRNSDTVLFGCPSKDVVHNRPSADK